MLASIGISTLSSTPAQEPGALVGGFQFFGWPHEDPLPFPVHVKDIGAQARDTGAASAGLAADMPATSRADSARNANPEVPERDKPLATRMAPPQITPLSSGIHQRTGQGKSRAWLCGTMIAAARHWMCHGGL
jgi:hypothetical protein